MTLSAATGSRLSRSAPSPAESALIWTPAALARWATLAGISAVTLVATWYYASGEKIWNDQVPAVDIAIFAAIVCGGANISILTAGRRAIGVRREALLGQPSTLATAKSEAAVITLAASSTELVAQPGLAHFHRADCSMAAGRGWKVDTRAAHDAAGRTPCGVCRP